MPLITIFTPVYNRAYIIPQLYESLKKQTSKDFEWLIVDDGSSDNIKELVDLWVEKEKDFPIRFIFQKNGGKHTAINRGVQLAQGEFFFIVDSDDYLTPDAVSWIIQASKGIQYDIGYAGISGIRIHPDGTKIGGGSDFGVINTNALDIRFKYHIVGDLAEIYKTDVLRKYPFPKYENERFCPEALVWNRIARRYNLRYVHKGIYVCEYREDGLTAKITALRRKSPVTSSIYYSELYREKIPLIQKIKAAINFHRFSDKNAMAAYKMISLISLLAYIPGKLMRINDNKSILS